MSDSGAPRPAPTRPERDGKAAPARRPASGEQGKVSTREALRQRGPSKRRLSRHQRDERMRRAILLGGTTLLVTIALVLGGGYLYETVVRAGETAAIIFGERLSTGDLAEEVRPRLTSLDRRVAAMRGAGMTQQATSLQFQRDQLPESVLNDLVEDRVIRREAASRGIVVSQADIDEELRERVAQADQANQPQPTSTPAPTVAPDTTPTTVPTPVGTPTQRPTPTPVPTLTEDRYGPAQQEFLLQSGLTEQQLRRAIETELYEQKLRTAMGEAEVPAIQEQVRASHIVFKTEEEAQQGLEQLQSGATTFEELARTASQDNATKDQGGDLGWIPKLGRDPAFDEAAFALQPGQISGVVQTDNGWEIIRVEERDPARPVPQTQLDEMRQRRFGDWLAAAMGNPEINRELSAAESAWVLERAGGRRS